jgi:hypothetical protein
MDKQFCYRVVQLTVLFLVLNGCNRSSENSSTNMSTNKEHKSQPKTDDQAIVIGQQLADAHKEEAKRKESGGQDNPMLTKKEYSLWNGDLDLINPSRNELDAEIRVVCKQYSQMNANDRAKFRQATSMEQFYTLIDFAKRSAVYGVRYSDPKIVADGLIAIAMIEQKRVDFRDIVWCLGLLYHSANRAGGNADEMFQSAAVFAEAEVTEFIINFIEQSPKYRNLKESWGYDEVVTEAGVGFIGWGHEEYNPSIDLKQPAVEVAELLDTDSYKSSNVEVATELPVVWFGKEVNAGRDRVLSRIRGGATINASLLPKKHPDHSSQQFTVFVVETATEADAHMLRNVAESNNTTNFSKLVLANSNLFCLVVARSFVVGKDSYESNETLLRFSPGLTAILKRFSSGE